MLSNYSGEFAALLTSVFWTITALSFEVASKRVGSLSVNMIRLVMAFLLLGIFTYFRRGMFFPLDASPHAWTWLAISGLVGFVFGDYFLFRAFALMNARISMLIMTLVPPITALIGWLFLKEVMNFQQLAAMFIVVGGIGMAIVTRSNDTGKVKFSYPIKGIFFAFLGTLGQAIGLILSKYGMQSYDAFAASHIRIIAGMVGFAIIVIMLNKTPIVRKTMKDRKGMTGITIGAFFGPFLGVSFSLIAVQHIHTGVAATLMSLMPVLIILPSIWLFKQKFSKLEIIGAAVSVVGVSLFFI